jgi:hypothetical protein
LTLVRRGGQLLDDERHCVACPTLAVAEEHQTVLPGKVQDLRAQARAFARLAEEKAAEADALEAKIESAEPHATSRAVELPSEKSYGDGFPVGGPESPARGERMDGTAEVPDQLDIRSP